jgi:hypothetical protein
MKRLLVAAEKAACLKSIQHRHVMGIGGWHRHGACCVAKCFSKRVHAGPHSLKLPNPLRCENRPVFSDFSRKRSSAAGKTRRQSGAAEVGFVETSGHPPTEAVGARATFGVATVDRDGISNEQIGKLPNMAELSASVVSKS